MLKSLRIKNVCGHTLCDPMNDIEETLLLMIKVWGRTENRIKLLLRKSILTIAENKKVKWKNNSTRLFLNVTGHVKSG